MTHTERTQAWLDQHFQDGVAERLRAGPERLYLPGDRIGLMPIGHVVVLARTCAILESLAGVEFQSCLDVGAGTGRLSHLIETLYGVRCAGVDLSRAFAHAARQDFGIPVYVANAAVLPFADAQFDLVLCSEVLEHVEHPFAVMAELCRVARRAVVITTQEVCRSPWQRRLQMAAVERSEPHAERNYFLADDFRRVFGPEVHIQALLDRPERIRLFRYDSVAGLERLLRALITERSCGAGSFGVCVIARKEGEPVVPRATPATIMQQVIDTDRRDDARLAARLSAPGSAADRSADAPLLGAPAPVCPECRGTLEVLPSSSGLRCSGCAALFPIRQGVPELLGSAQALARSEQAWASRQELEPVRQALRQRALPLRCTRRILRAAIKAGDFWRLPVSGFDKLRLAWRILGSP